MAIPSYVIDGASVTGSFEVSINGVTYVLDDVNIDREVIEAKQMDVTGAPGQARRTHGWSNGTGTLQIPTGLSRPQFGQYFNKEFDANYGTETWVLDPVSFVATADASQIRKIPISFHRCENGIPTTGGAL